MNRDVVGVELCRRLEKAIGAEWASGAFYSGKNYIVCQRYTLGDLLAYCKSRKWSVKQLMLPKDFDHPLETIRKTSFAADINTGGGSGGSARDKTAPAALALAVLAAVAAGGGGK